MIIKPIRTAKDHKAALEDISKLMVSDPAIGTPKGDRLDVLVTLVQAYEAQHFRWSWLIPLKRLSFVWSSKVSPRGVQTKTTNRAFNQPTVMNRSST